MASDSQRVKIEGMKILGIETSCDETSASVVEDGNRLLSLVTNSQIETHKAYGGVIPEIAAREHIQVVTPVIDQALRQAGLSLSQIDAIAVTSGPGLLGSLIVGVQTAKTLGLASSLPIYPVHHIMGHVYANFITESEVKLNQPLPKNQPKFPMLAIIVSGGHTQLMYFSSHLKFEIVGRTLDDAIGEAIDKAAKVLGLPYPGGISIYERAKSGQKDAIALPTPKTEGELDFSFSGLKTAMLRAAQKSVGGDFTLPSFEIAPKMNQQQIDDFAASFQNSAYNYLVAKAKLAYAKLNPKSVVVGGGVAASPELRAKLQEALGIDIEYAPAVLCTDNAAMIASAGYFYSQLYSPTSPHQIKIEPNKRVFTGN